MTTEQTAMLAAVCSAFATVFAAFATWYAPRAAAKLAEALRQDAERHNERLRSKMNILATLMQERGQIYSENSVRALNLIDVVFNDSREVREAWSELYLAFGMKPLVDHVIHERLRKLLAAIAHNIGLSDALRNDDLGRIYRPNIQVEEQFIKDMQRRDVLARLQSNAAGANAATTTQNTDWPPPPSPE